MKFGREGPRGGGGYDPNAYSRQQKFMGQGAVTPPPGQQGFSGQMPLLPPPGSLGNSPGSIRNTLGSALKSMGIFQKDGRIQNMRGGFIGPKQGYNPALGHQTAPGYQTAPGHPAFPPGSSGPAPYPSGQGLTGAAAGAGVTGAAFGQGVPGIPGRPGVSGQAAAGGQSGGGNMGTGPFSFLGAHGQSIGQTRQLILQAAREDIIGNGVATISPDNTYVMVANLPPPQTFQAMLPGAGRVVYATYLVDKKGKTGFLAGVLSPVGNGVYRAQFRSQVPLTSYERAIVSAEDPQRLGQAPNGPIVLMVKEPMGPAAVFKPLKNAAGSVWGKIAGLTKRGAKPPLPSSEVVPGGGAAIPETMQQALPNIPPPPPNPPLPPN